MDDGLLSPVRRDALLALFALGLLVAPLWAPLLHLSGPTYHYEGTEVVVDDTGLAYADDSMNDLNGAPISDDIACSDQYDVRPCALESLVADGGTVPTDWYRGSLGQNLTQGADPSPGPSPSSTERYRYALVDGTVYETSYVINGSVQNENGNYRIDLALEPAEPSDVLQSVSVRASDEAVPSVVAEAARSGDADAPTAVDLPETPVRIEDDGDDRYYRVFSNGSSDETAPTLALADWLLRYAAPLVAVVLLATVWRRIEVTHVGGED